MKERLPGQNITLENRSLAYDSVPKGKRCNQIIEILEDLKQATAMEIAEEMLVRGYIRILDRNASAPRLTELSQEGIVEPIGSKKDKYFNKDVTVYALTKMYLQKRTFNYDTVTLQDIETNNNFIWECDGDNNQLILKKEF